MQAVLRRQRASEQPYVADEGRLENLREAGYAVGQQNSVDPVLNVAVLVADVKIPLARRVLVDTRKLQRNVAKLRSVSLREILDVPLIELIGRGASLRQDDIVASLVEGLGLLDDLTIGRGLDLPRGRRRQRRPRGSGLTCHHARLL